ncbi:oligosaccharide flippase family protein [Leptolyngbya ohadii]|uniref:oligosaccharide flippase family protein n=1 Tax=Leptolyngbya ohadii TaxID=1962290 RepID=UPI000B5990C0|nr:oligosaccharide flippase family protein [Leptolyngbya ohadii]
MKRLFQSFNRSFIRNTLWMVGAQASSLLLQLGYFVITARALGAADYGTFIGITSFAAVLVPFVGLGSGDILVKKVARDRTVFSKVWGDVLVITLISGILLTMVSAFVAKTILPDAVSFQTILVIIISDLLFLKLWDAAGKAFLAREWMSLTARVRILLSFNKFLAAIAYLLFFRASGIWGWALLYLTATVATAVICLLLVGRMLGLPQFRLSHPRDLELGQGLFFSVSASSDSINASIDKTMLASLSTLEVTGLYAAAYRCIEVGYIGFHAVSAVTYAKFFRQGADGIKGSFHLAKRLLPIMALYGVGCWLFFFIVAPLIPYVLGSEYANSVQAVYWLAPVLLLLALQYPVADTLTGAGFQGARSSIQVSSAILNVLLNLWLIPIYSWRGAAFATLVSESLKLAFLSVAVWFFYYKHVHGSRHQDAGTHDESPPA